MGSSAKKKREKHKDFQKTKLKVGQKPRPTNTNATSTAFTSKSITLRQQSLAETSRDGASLFNHNLSLLSTKNDAQRRDALAFLTTTVAAGGSGNGMLPQPVSVIVGKAQALILDGSKSVREQLLKFFKVLPASEMVGANVVEQLLLYTRAGMAHMSADIKLSSLLVLDWLLDSCGEAVIGCPGGWVKTLRTFQHLLVWESDGNGIGAMTANPTTGKLAKTTMTGKWSNTKPAASSSLGSNKLLVQQLTTLAHFLATGLRQPILDPTLTAQRTAVLFPLAWHADAHMLSVKGNPFGYLNLFGAPRDMESEVYADAEERAKVFEESGLKDVFASGVKEAKREAGEVGRAASGVEKVLRVAGAGG